MIQAKILAEITQRLIFDQLFKERTRKRPEYFTRAGKLPFEYLVLFTLESLKTTTSTGIRRFFKKMERDESMTQQSVSEAKAKLKWEGFEYLYRHSTVVPLVDLNRQTWNGYFIYAVDGSKIALPVDKKLLAYYGSVGRGSKSPTAQGSILYDVLNDIIVDAAIEPIKVDERILAHRHIEAIKTVNEGDDKLITFDRGYPSFKLIKKLEEEGLKYVMRVKSKFNQEIDAQVEDDGVVWLEKDGEKVKVRVVKVELDSGEIETLITNVHDSTLGVDDFKKLYFLRWGCELKYGILKNKLEIENFSSKTIDGVKIDFFASMYMANYMASVEHDVKNEIAQKRENRENKYEYKVNKNELVGILKDYLIVAIASDCPKQQEEIFDRIFREAKHNVIPIRPNRKVARNPYPRKSKFHHNQKSNA
jgi:hypothetical protein